MAYKENSIVMLSCYCQLSKRRKKVTLPLLFSRAKVGLVEEASLVWNITKGDYLMH